MLCSPGHMIHPDGERIQGFLKIAHALLMVLDEPLKLAFLNTAQFFKQIHRKTGTTGIFTPG